LTDRQKSDFTDKNEKGGSIFGTKLLYINAKAVALAFLCRIDDTPALRDCPMQFCWKALNPP
jgi:hypothetical protein